MENLQIEGERSKSLDVTFTNVDESFYEIIAAAKN
jgi:hypothetical protein